MTRRGKMRIRWLHLWMSYSAVGCELSGYESTIWYIEKKEEEICLSEAAVQSATITSEEYDEAWKRQKSG